MTWTSIALDVDNVLAETNATFCIRANRQWGTTFTKENIKYPKIIGSFRANPEHVFRIQEEVWENWQQLPTTEKDVGKVVETLRNRGHKIMIATSRSHRSINYVKQWLSAHMINYDLFCRVDPQQSKSILGADVLIDDDSAAIGDFVLANRQRKGLLYDQPWNRFILPMEGITRIKTLNEILPLIGNSPN